jgi:uridylate kinase
VYTADPKKDPAARAIPQITWKDLIAMLPAKWSPGLSAPFDPIAARKAQKLKLTVSIVNGKDLDNVMQAVDGVPFQGTVITG